MKNLEVRGGKGSYDVIVPKFLKFAESRGTKGLQFVGKEEFLLGNVFDGLKRKDISNEFKLCNVYAKTKCKDCYARFYCSGGCAANSYSFHGSITDTYDTGCELQKKRIECAIMIKAALAG